MTRRQPLAARVRGTTLYRTWWPPYTSRLKRRAQRRSARHERVAARTEIQQQHQDG
jgi:hypothetical protein